MAPIRRYLRITKYSVIECRIYLDNPALAESWLLNSRNPILPRVFESVRPLVLPKLREENERSKGKGKGSKKKSVKDVVVEEDFQVSIFLTETSTRHSLLTKLKHFREPKKKGLESNSSKLMGATNDTAIEVEDRPVALREESDEAPFDLDELPDVDDAESVSDSNSLFVDDEEGPRRSKRPRTNTNAESSGGAGRPSKRSKDSKTADDEQIDEKKKMAMQTSYDGFAIYGRVLCLVVKRKDKGKAPSGRGEGQATMENWITSTQMPAEEADDP